MNIFKQFGNFFASWAYKAQGLTNSVGQTRTTKKDNNCKNELDIAPDGALNRPLKTPNLISQLNYP